MLDKSLARGLTRVALRNAERTIRKRLADMCPQAHSAVKDEASAKKLAAASIRIYRERLVFLRTELAGRHSEVSCVAFETLERDARLEFWVSVIVSSHGGISGRGDLHISHHAVERFLQRETKLITDFSPVFFEFAPASLMLINASAAVTGSGAQAELLLPTRSGALLAKLEQADEDVFYVGTTWVRNNQLRRAQEKTRAACVDQCAQIIRDACVPTARRGSFAGRGDEVVVQVNHGLRDFATGPL